HLIFFTYHRHPPSPLLSFFNDTSTTYIHTLSLPTLFRSCLATNTSLHLIHPLGFSIDDKQLKRAGLDYWENVDVHEYDHIDALYEKYPKGLLYYLENYGTKYNIEADFNHQQGDVCLIF